MLPYLIGKIDEERIGIQPSMLRLILASYILGQMMQSGGSKEDKVKAAFEYADLLMKG